MRARQKRTLAVEPSPLHVGIKRAGACHRLRTCFIYQHAVLCLLVLFTLRNSSLPRAKPCRSPRCAISCPHPTYSVGGIQHLSVSVPTSLGAVQFYVLPPRLPTGRMVLALLPPLHSSGSIPRLLLTTPWYPWKNVDGVRHRDSTWAQPTAPLAHTPYLPLPTWPPPSLCLLCWFALCLCSPSFTSAHFLPF